jgi:hypothetical protein
MTKSTRRERKSESGNFKPIYQVSQSIWGTRLALVMYRNVRNITLRLAPMQLSGKAGPLWISYGP